MIILSGVRNMENRNSQNSVIEAGASIGSDTIEKLLETVPPEKLLSILQELENKKREKLQKELKDIEEQIAALNSKAAKIREELGLSQKGRRSRSATQFMLDGIPMSASAIARSFNLPTEGINWRIKLLSILSGNSGGLSEALASEIRRRVTIIDQ
jgi:glutaminase